MNIHLDRFAYTPMGTFGHLVYGGFECFTVERPWEDNKPFHSCIPVGIYDLQPSRYHRGGYDSFEIVDVTGRSQIKIHIGNTMDDVVGCIALGEKLGLVKNHWAVLSSTRAFHAFYDETKEERPEKIIITNYLGGGGSCT